MLLASGNRGTYVFDRGYDSRYMFALMKEHGCDFIIRAVGSRDLIVEGKEQSFEEVAKSVKRPLTVMSKSGKDSFECEIKRVKIRLDGYPKRVPQTIEVWLVVARFIPKKKGTRLDSSTSFATCQTKTYPWI